MQQDFLQRLNADTRRLVEEIETFAGSEIDVRPTPAPTQPTERQPKAVALIASEQGATLLYRSAQEFRPQAVLHELLHLQRYWIERTPQLVAAADPGSEKTSIASEVENALEHLIIVPREADYGFDPHAHWNEISARIWQDYPWAAVSAPWARRKQSLLAWLTTSRLAADRKLVDRARVCLEREHLVEEAENFAAKIGRVLSSKERCISTAVRFLRIPRAETAMVYFDIKNKRITRLAVPEH